MKLICYSIFVLFCVYKIYDELTKEYVNPYKLIMVFGKKGAGKTTFLTKTAICALRQGKTVYSTVFIPGTIKIDASEFGVYKFNPGSIVLIDEVSLVWSNRDFKVFSKTTEQAFRLQRHDRITVYLFSQSFDIDKKIRDLTDSMYLLSNKFRVFSLARKIEKFTDINNQRNDGMSKIDESFEFASILAPGSMIWTFIPRWKEFFNSFVPAERPLMYRDAEPLTDFQASIISDKGWKKYRKVRAKENAVYQLKLIDMWLDDHNRIYHAAKTFSRFIKNNVDNLCSKVMKKFSSAESCDSCSESKFEAEAISGSASEVFTTQSSMEEKEEEKKEDNMWGSGGTE